MSKKNASATVLVTSTAPTTSASSTKGPSATKTQHIPLSVSNASGERMYVLENEAYHQGAAMVAGRSAGRSQQNGGARGCRRSGHGDKGARGGDALPDMTASLADFNVVGKFDVEEAKRPKVRIDDSEWVVVPSSE